MRLFERYKFLTSYQLIYLKIKLSYKLFPNLLKTIRKFHINEKPVYHKTKFFDKQLKLFCLRKAGFSCLSDKSVANKCLLEIVSYTLSLSLSLPESPLHHHRMFRYKRQSWARKIANSSTPTSEDCPFYERKSFWPSTKLPTRVNKLGIKHNYLW